ncbi:hypothetical protein Rcae01_01444 [Novipirellula caenicola]|uniref:Uncharacterized protein n=1 Tax=Novipirellula caenicola TaxID=1536901 RepID=A0ABP9VLC2_9BACT
MIAGYWATAAPWLPDSGVHFRELLLWGYEVWRL